MAVATGLQFRCRNGSRPPERRGTTVAGVVFGAFMNDRNLYRGGTGRTKWGRTLVQWMFLFGVSVGELFLVSASARTGNNTVAFARENDSKLVAEIVLEVDDSGVWIDVFGACVGVEPFFFYASESFRFSEGQL